MSDEQGPPVAPERDAEGLVSPDSPQFQVAAKHPQRVERTTAVLFLASLVGFVGFGIAYTQNGSTQWLGLTIGLGMLAFGFAMAAWGKFLMPRGPFEEPRAPMATTKEEKEAFVSDFATRGKVAVERRSFLVKLMGAAAAILGIVAAFPLIRSLGPLPGKSFYKTAWRKGSYLTTIDNRRVKVGDVEVGGVLTVFPESDVGGAISQTILVRPQTTAIVTKPGRESWAPQGYIAFSKVCTHAGCPVGLYEEQVQQLLCPCHQSLFDIYAGAEPIFGPAPRPLAQLPLFIDSSGYLRAQAGYDEPVGPGFWERGGTT
ncbi:MAG: Rieske (2Fe-2S) domain protein [Acidimicrobiaceae bacterium]|nr:Rieske (2Fe-2S) domain protein [Acidimicrobiaceae bacterium]